MGTIKTAISLHQQLLRDADALARQMKLSRSGLFAAALEEYIQRRRNRELLDKINNAYADQADPAERKYLKRMRQRHRRIVEGEW